MNPWVLIGLAALFLLGGASVAYAVKTGAVPSDRPEVVYMRGVLARIWANHGYRLTITSGLDGEHRDDSLHYEGLAEDYRSRDVKREDLAILQREAQAALGPNYQFFLEYLNGPNEHFHGEFDPD